MQCDTGSNASANGNIKYQKEVAMQAEIERILRLTERDVGPTEENVKLKIVVPVLELLGHKMEDVEFEHRTRGGGKIDIILGRNLPHDCKVIIDTKKYNEELDDHIDQVKNYAFDEAALLAVLANGTVFKIYAQLRGVAFERSLLHVIQRNDFGKESVWKTLATYLGVDNLKDRSVHERIAGRERQIKGAMANEGIIRQDFEDKIKELKLKIDGMEDELAQLKEQEVGLAKELEVKIAEVWKGLDLPPPAVDAAMGFSSRMKADEEWAERSQKARKVTFQELIENGCLKNGESLYLCYRTKEFKDCKAQVVGSQNQLKYRDGKLYSKSDLASRLLREFKVITHPSVQGPQCWKTLGGKLLLDLERSVRERYSA